MRLSKRTWEIVDGAKFTYRGVRPSLWVYSAYIDDEMSTEFATCYCIKQQGATMHCVYYYTSPEKLEQGMRLIAALPKWRKML